MAFIIETPDQENGKLSTLLGRKFLFGIIPIDIPAFIWKSQLPDLIKFAIFCLSSYLLGRKYNKNGDLKNWWSCSSNKAFEDKSKCFVDQYSSYEAYGKKVCNQSIEALNN